MDLIPYMLVVGPKEAESNSVNVRCRIDGELGVMTLDAAIQKLTEERNQRTIRQVAKRTDTAVLPPSGGEQNEY
jgi:threonyl-tRNA synthetase